MNSKEFNKYLYDSGNKELNPLYKDYKNNRDDLLERLAFIMLTYNILDGYMKIQSKDKVKEFNILNLLVNSFTKKTINKQKNIITNITTNTVKNKFGFYSYNANLKDVKKIVENSFKGKHFSTRVWDNENLVSQKIKSEIKNFISGRTNVNDIKKNIEKTFDTTAYNARRLTETEISRCSNGAFDRFCKETNVEKVTYNTYHDEKLCPICAPDDGVIFEFEKRLLLPRHPLCRCYYDIAK